MGTLIHFGSEPANEARTQHGLSLQAGYRLPAASLLEAIVASVVLMVVFAVSLETVVRLTAGDSGSIACAEADYRAAHVLGKVREGTYGEGTTQLTFGWGSLTIRIESYDPCPELWSVTLTMEIPGEHKKDGNSGRAQKDGIQTPDRSRKLRRQTDASRTLNLRK